MIAGGLLACFPALAPATAETLRIATFNVGLARDGPGLLLRDILRGGGRQIDAATSVIARVDPDVILLTGFDYDRGLVALRAFAAGLEIAGARYPFLFAYAPNTGVATGLDLDGDGRRGGPGDAQGYGAFAGQGGMALLSRLPVDAGQSRDLSGFLWRDLPGALVDGAGLSAEARAVQRLSANGQWDVVLHRGDGSDLHILAFYASPPVFDGPEDRNGRRNHDEVMFWKKYLDGALPEPGPKGQFVLLGDANLDPNDGDGRSVAMRELLADPALHDPRPESMGAIAAAVGAQNRRHQTFPGLDTVDWTRLRSGAPGPGNLRVDYVLPSADLTVTSAGVFWPAPDDPDARLLSGDTGLAHHLVWADVE